jgi:prolyl-tRNA editing enzyme YbaK/EbsC (Cys-tRNA(Pro) deacylase)
MTTDKVQAVLAAAGLTSRVQVLPSSARTAQEAADAIGCPVARIAKSLLFRSERTAHPVLVVACGTNQVDVAKLATRLGEPIGKADASYVREQTGYAIGGVPPFAHLRAIETYLDLDLFRHETVWAAAGSPFSVFEIAPHDLERISRGERLDIARRSTPRE